MVSISGTSCTRGLLLILVVCSFACVAVGRGVATGDEVIARVEGSGGADGAVGVEDGGSRVVVDGAGDDESTRRSDHSEDAGTGDEAKSTPAHGGTCTREHGPVIASLAASGGDGEDGDHDYTLTVENGGGKSQLVVSIKTPKGVKASMKKSDGLKADLVDMKLDNGKRETVTITVIDKEAAMLGARINVSWGEGDCYVELPAENVGDNVTHPSLLSLLTAQGTFALVLGGTLVFVLILGAVGVWGCVSWRARARRHGDAEAKYQELEMTLPAAVSKQDDGMSPSADGWDEVWEDDDWQDTEAVRTSSASLTLSANGLNSRRANRDGWDSSWDE